MFSLQPPRETAKLVRCSLSRAVTCEHPTADNLGGLGKSHEIGVPVQIYPLFENGFRAHTGLSIKENHSESTQLYASFDKVASENEYGWNYGRDSSSSLDRIGKVDDKNRMICFPCRCLDKRVSKPRKLTVTRSSPNERFQHGKPRRCMSTYLHKSGGRTWYSEREMDLPVRRCRNNGQRRL